MWLYGKTRYYDTDLYLQILESSLLNNIRVSLEWIFSVQLLHSDTVSFIHTALHL